MSNELPKDWKWMKLGEIAEITSSRRIFQDEYVNNGVPFFRTKEIKELNEGREISIELFITNEKYNEIKSKNEIPKIGDILLSAVGTIGVSYIIRDDKPFYFKDGNLVWIRKLNGVIPKYLHFNFAHFIRFKQGITTSGSAYNALTIIKLKAFEIPLPPKPTQQAIVSKIEELFSEIEKGIESLFTARQQLKTYRQSVLKWAFEGKLTNSRNHDSYDLHDEHDLNIASEPGNDYKPKNHGLDKGELPKGWKKITIAEIAIINPKLPDKENINENLEVQFLPMKLVEEIVNKFHLIETKTFKEVQRKSYTPFINGDIIFAKVTPCMENGKIAIVDNLKNGIGYGSSEFHVVRCSKDALNKYVFYFLVQDRFRNEAQNAMTGAVGLRRVPKQFIENHLIPLPLIKEQKDIIEEIESRLSVADKMEESITQSLQQAEALRQSILKKAFEGKLI